MAPRICARLRSLIGKGQLRVMAGRIVRTAREGRGAAVEIARRGGGREHFAADYVINCTGPTTNIAHVEYPVLADLRRRGLIVPDALGLGIETQDCAVIDARGAMSDWLFAVGALTQAAWWEITAVPEINAQINRLIHNMGAIRQGGARRAVPLTADFLDLGAGI
jgi:uncharacterized NAD(P)/FAD-binding protein YdhS